MKTVQQLKPGMLIASTHPNFLRNYPYPRANKYTSIEAADILMLTNLHCWISKTDYKTENYYRFHLEIQFLVNRNVCFWHWSQAIFTTAFSKNTKKYFDSIMNKKFDFTGLHLWQGLETTFKEHMQRFEKNFQILINE